MTMIFVIPILLEIIGLVSGFECSGIDISKENRLNINDLTGLWYTHLIYDTDNFVAKHSKFFFKSVDGRRQIREFYAGWSAEENDCSVILFNDTQLIPRLPCMQSLLVHPVVGTPADFIYTFLDDENSKLLVYGRGENVGSMLGFAATRNKLLRPREKIMFEDKMREFGAILPAGGLIRQNPSNNDCEKFFPPE